MVGLVEGIISGSLDYLVLVIRIRVVNHLTTLHFVIVMLFNIPFFLNTKDIFDQS